MNRLLKALTGQYAKEAFDQISPRSVGRRVVEGDVGMKFEPGLRLAILVRVQIVENDTEALALVRVDDVIQEREEIGRGAALLYVGDHLAGLYLKARQDGTGSMADIFVGPTTSLFRSQGQHRLLCGREPECRFSRPRKAPRRFSAVSCKGPPLPRAS